MEVSSDAWLARKQLETLHGLVQGQKSHNDVGFCLHISASCVRVGWGGACAGEQWTPLTLNTPILVAAILGAAGGLGFLLLLIICMCGREAHPWDRPLKGSLFKKYRLRDVQAMTDGFSDASVVGRGALWTAYCGRTRDGTPCAVKVHTQVTQYAYEKEVMAAQRLRHRNLVSLLGYCVERGHHILVYEYDPYKSLQERLHGSEQIYAVLTVQRRLSAALGVAQGLQHLHSNGYFHVDVIPTNIWIDREGTAKLADLGFLKETEGLTAATRPRDAAKVSTLVLPPDPVLDIDGYLDPEYGVKHRHGWRVDVYRIGVLLLELLTGRRPLVGAQDQEAALRLLQGKANLFYPPPVDYLSRILPKGPGSTPARKAQEGPEEKQQQKIRLPPMHIRVWAETMMSAGDIASLLDPRIQQVEAIDMLAHPESTEAELRRQVLYAYFALALCCTGPSEQRPLPRFIISELAGLGRLWRASRMVLLAHPETSRATSVGPSDAWDSVHSGREPSHGHMSTHEVHGYHSTSAGCHPPRYATHNEEEAPTEGATLWCKTADSSRNEDGSFFTPVSSAAAAVSHSCSLARSTAHLEADSSTAVPRRRQFPPRTVKAIVRVLIHSGMGARAASTSDADTTFSLQPSMLTSHCSSFAGTGPSQGTMNTRQATALSSCTTMNTRAATVLSSCTTMETGAPAVLSSSGTMAAEDVTMPISSNSARSLSTGSV